MNYFRKLFFIIITIVCTSSIIISSILITRNVNNMQESTKRNLVSSAQQKVKLYDRNIESLSDLSKSISNGKEIIEFFQQVRKGNTDELFYNRRRSDLEAEMKIYSSLLENAFFTYDGLCYIDGIGGSSVGYDSSQSEWYINVAKTKSHYLETVKKSPITGLPVMISACPILDENNELLSIFCLSINLNGFSNAIIENPGNTGENTIIMDENGSIAASNDTNLIYSYNIAKELPELYEYISGHDNGITYYSINDIKYMAAVKRSDLGVTIIQSIPTSTYEGPIQLSIILSSLIIAATLGAAAVVSYIIAKNISKPIQILVEELNDMGEGNYEKPIPDYLKKRKDEFKTLGIALEEMKNQTSQLIIKLELANEEAEVSLEEIIAGEDELRKQNELLTESENKLQISNDYHQAIITVLPDTIYIIDKEGIITEDQETIALFPVEEAMKRNIYDFIDFENAELLMEKIHTAIATGLLQIHEYEMISENNNMIFEMRIVPCFEDKVLAIARDMTNQRLYQRQIEYLSYHDQLTNLPNRRYFEEEMKRLDAEQYLPLCIMMGDVNGLKLVNDSFGHHAGDELLIKFAGVLREKLPEENLISRIGGDEFVLILPNIEQDYAEELYTQIREDCEKESVKGISLSVSLGWDVRYRMEEDINEILKSAEDSMYKKKLFDGPSMRGRTIDIIINTLNEKNHREEQHSCRVAELCEKLGEAMNMPEHSRMEIRSAGLLHDIGKIAIPEVLLNKPGRLTEEEYSEIKRHPEIGYRILCSANEMLDIAEYVLSHHERWDGKGYPRGLKGEEISLQSRMIAIADTFDAMTSLRSYRDPVSIEEAAEEILKNAGTQFDPELALLFVHKVLGL